MKVKAFVVAGGFLFFATGVSPLFAQLFPSKPLRMILPFPPGGPTDLLGRTLGQKMAENIGHAVIIDNRPGAGGNLGVELAAKAPPDGYTMVLSSPLISISPSLYAKGVVDKFAAAGIDPLPSSPEQFASFIRSETVRYAKVIKDAGIKPE